MKSKLTLRLDPSLIRQVKKTAKERGTSVWQLVADYFSALGAGRGGSEALTPTVRELKGCLREELKKQAYRRHLEKKYL